MTSREIEMARRREASAVYKAWYAAGTFGMKSYPEPSTQQMLIDLHRVIRKRMEDIPSTPAGELQLKNFIMHALKDKMCTNSIYTFFMMEFM
jgi:hypothetical protein